MAEKKQEDGKSTFSFGFQKKQEVKKLSKSAVGETGDLDDGSASKDFVLSVEGKELKSSKPLDRGKKGPEEYVIPLIRQNKWRADELDKKLEKILKLQQTSDANDLEKQAAEEIMKDVARYNDEWEDRGKDDTSLNIPLLMQNKVPDGFETDDKLDVALRPEVPDDADYDKIPIEHFGMAMLRGMGWKEGTGIGKNGKVIAPIDAQLRPKGLGLGADRSVSGKDKTKDKLQVSKEEEVAPELKKNSYCKIIDGVNKGLYGYVEGVDEDNARVMVKLTISSKIVNIMERNAQAVSKTEYEKFSKYLNKEKVDKFKEEEEKKKVKDSSDLQNGDSKRSRKHKNRGSSDSEDEQNVSKHKKSRKDRDSERNRSSHSSSSTHHKSHKSKKSKHKKDSRKHRSPSPTSSSQSESEPPQKPWLRTDLRVRIIDKDLKKGKLFKEKVVIVDVPSPGTCVCKTADGKIVENVSQNSLETVVPRLDDSYIAIVSGSSCGQIGQIMKRDKDRCLVLVQLLSDRDTVLKLSYDDVCEYLGDVGSHDDY